MKKKRRLNKRKIFSLILTIGIVFGLIFLDRQSMIEFQDETVIEYGTKIDAADLIAKCQGKLIAVPELDSLKLGKQDLVYTVQGRFFKRKYHQRIEVVDRKKPIIQLKEAVFELKTGREWDVSANIIRVYDEVDGDLPYQTEGIVDNKKIGEYPIKVYTSDKNGNESSAEFLVKVTAHEFEVIDGVTYIDGILLVNKEYSLPREYGGLKEDAWQALTRLRNDAQNCGYDLPILSGYRSYDYQAELFEYWVSVDGLEEAERSSARAGHSEHQSGYTFDIGVLNEEFGASSAGRWLAENCQNYGFIIRYPQGKEEITGYIYEPWHIRYVGKEAAVYIMAHGICLEEYLGLSLD